RARISSRSLRSGPGSKRPCPSGTGTPKRRASVSAASGKLTRSRSIRNLKTSPPSPQPKQWKTAGSERTLKDGVFSWWNGQGRVVEQLVHARQRLVDGQPHQIDLRRLSGGGLRRTPPSPPARSAEMNPASLAARCRGLPGQGHQLAHRHPQPLAADRHLG